MCLHDFKTLTGMSLALLLLNTMAVHLFNGCTFIHKHTTTYTIN